MDFKSGKKSIAGLFTCKKQFIIPRFQREYAWGKVELSEFLDDILIRIRKNDDNKLSTSEYFWGSLLLIGDLDDQKVLGVEVVDGQQRITTMTIFLSVIAKMFAKEGENNLANALWEFIIGKDTNTNEFAILKNETPKPYFQFTIQKLSEDDMTPSNIEEEKILAANKFFKSNLTKNGLKKRLNKLGKEEITHFSYVELLKIIRDQLLLSYVIEISTEDREYANMIFEILNAKGKELASVDLIKNAIFEKLTSEVPADTAKERWLSIRNNLCSRNNRIEFATFFRHFWIMRYGKVQDSKLYSDFLKKVKKTDESYLNFMKEMEKFSKIYSRILTPLISDYSNKKEYNFLIKSLSDINEVYGIVQIRPVIMSLLFIHEDKKILSLKNFKKIILGIANFHLIYNAICSKRTSGLETPINTFSHDLYNCSNELEVKNVCKSFKDSLEVLVPKKEEFTESLRKLKYSKEPLATNVLTKHIIYDYEMILANKYTLEDDGSIEHIYDENMSEGFSLTLGNLVLLEQNINNIIPKCDFLEKSKFYLSSNYASIKELLDFSKENRINSFSEEIIQKRFSITADKIYSYVTDKISKMAF